MAVEAAHAAEDILLEGFSAPDKQLRTKRHPYDPVTVYDRRAEEAIVGCLAAAYPHDGIVAEESPDLAGRSGRRWIVDPLDGTSNFVAGIPHFAVSIALAAGEEPLLGCVHDPVRAETFTALRGGGTRVGTRAVRVSDRSALDGAAVSVGWSHDPIRRGRTIEQLRSLLPRAALVRSLGSAALDLAYIAAGRLDAAWYAALHPWDVAAGIVLVEEAGGIITDFAGGPVRDPGVGIVASNGRWHGTLLRAIG